MKSCDTTTGNGWTTGNTNIILNSKDHSLLATELRAARFGKIKVVRRGPVNGDVRQREEHV